MKRTSIEAHVYMRRHQGAKVKQFDVSNVVYHKFSHGAVSYTLSGVNVNVMLEFAVKHLSVYRHVLVFWNIGFLLNRVMILPILEGVADVAFDGWS